VAINNHGEVAGSYSLSASGFPTKGFIYDNGAFTTFDPPGAIYTFPYAINDHGEVTGEYIDSPVGAHGFIYETVFGPPVD
jgi:inosine/xanthosine triphosphate pyrophosphatase family protein